MKKFADTSKITILDLEKPDSYTDRGRYVVCIEGKRQLSANTEVEALKKTLAMMHDYKMEYEERYTRLLGLCAPIAHHLKPDQEEGDDY